MRIGIFGGDTAAARSTTSSPTPEPPSTTASRRYALPQIFALDAMGVLAIVGREVPRIELATGVVPTYSRHPLTMAQQALTVQAASGGRFALGIGLSHQIVIEDMFGLSFDKPRAAHARVPLGARCRCSRRQGVASTARRSRTDVAVGVDRPAPVPGARRRARRADARARGHRHRRHRHVDDRAGDARRRTPCRPSPPPRSRPGRPAPRIVTRCPICVTERRRRGARARGQGLPGLRLPAVVPRDARPRGRGRPGRRRDRRRRGDRRASRSRRLADAGVTEFVAADLRIARRARRDARAAAVDVVSADDAALSPRAARGARGRRSRDRARRSRTSRSTRCAGCSRCCGTARATRDARRRDVRRRDGRPARPGRRALPRPRRASSPTHGIATVRVGYRKPNDLAALRARRRRGRRPREPIAARAGSSSMGHSFGGAVAIQAGAVLGAHCRGRRDALDAVGRLRSTRPSSATRPCSCCHGTDDEILPPETSAVVQMLAGHGEVVLLPGAGHLLTQAADEVRERLLDVDPGALRRANAADRLGAGELGDDRRELVDVVVADDDVRQAPLLAAPVQLLDDLVLGADERRARLERLLRRRHRTPARAPRRASSGRRCTLVTKKRIWISMSSMRAPAASRIHCTLRSVCSRSESLAASSPISPARRFGLMPTMSASRAAIDSTRLPPPPIEERRTGLLHGLRATTRSR